MKKCPFCAEEIREEAIKCKHCQSDLSAPAQAKLASLVLNDRGADAVFLNASVDGVAGLFEAFFHSNEYTLESGTKVNGTYGLGSSAARLLSGGFAKRRIYYLNIKQAGNRVEAAVSSLMSGWSGLVLGAIREQRDRKDFNARLQAYLSRPLMIRDETASVEVPDREELDPEVETDWRVGVVFVVLMMSTLLLLYFVTKSQW